MMLPWPAMSRGTDATVPSPPGLVSVMVAPAKSSGMRRLVRAFSTAASYAAWNPAKSIVSARWMTGTTSPRLPSFRCTSTARPSPMPSGCTRYGAPSCLMRVWPITGCCLVACTSAQAMRWVKEILSRLPATWSAPLSRRRRSSSTPTGTTRKVVAVGIVRLCSMFATSLAAGPLRGLAPEGRAGASPEAVGRTGGRADGSVVGGVACSGPPSACPPVRLSAPFGLGLSPTTPLSKSRRHSGPTAAGSRRNSSYMACAKPALAVSNTLGSTEFTVW